MMARTIIITLAQHHRNHSGEHWSVMEDGRICDGLGWDEMLGTVCRITLGEGATYRMLTLEEHEDRAKKRAPRPATVDALAQLLDVFDNKPTAGPLQPAIDEARKRLAEERDEEIPF